MVEIVVFEGIGIAKERLDKGVTAATGYKVVEVIQRRAKRREGRSKLKGKVNQANNQKS